MTTREEALAHEVKDLVQGMYRQLGKTLYRSDKQKRCAIYEEVIRQLWQMIIIDGGPTYGIELFEVPVDVLRYFEIQRGCKKIGPFLSKRNMGELLRHPETLVHPSWLPQAPDARS